jgi:hypothetical protein
MPASEHRHEWVEVGGPGSNTFRCACDRPGLVHDFISAAAEDARQVAGPDYYTGCLTHRESNTLELWLASAPPEVLAELEDLHPGIYVIHNDAPRAERTVDELMQSFDRAAWKAEGIEVIAVGPSGDGYLRVGVIEDVEGAQKTFDAFYGPDVVRVYQQARIYAC